MAVHHDIDTVAHGLPQALLPRQAAGLVLVQRLGSPPDQEPDGPGRGVGCGHNVSLSDRASDAARNFNPPALAAPLPRRQHLDPLDLAAPVVRLAQPLDLGGEAGHAGLPRLAPGRVGLVPRVAGGAEPALSEGDGAERGESGLHGHAAVSAKGS